MLPGEINILTKLGVDVIVERKAGEKAFVTDDDYLSAGAGVSERKEIIKKSDLLLTVNPPLDDNIDSFKEDQIIFTVLNPVENHSWLDKARLHGLTVFALDMVPRITRAQAMDILSSMATVSGYKAVLHAASMIPMSTFRSTTVAAL